MLNSASIRINWPRTRLTVPQVTCIPSLHGQSRMMLRTPSTTRWVKHSNWSNCPLKNLSSLMVCLHCPIPIPIPTQVTLGTNPWWFLWFLWWFWCKVTMGSVTKSPYQYQYWCQIGYSTFLHQNRNHIIGIGVGSVGTVLHIIIEPNFIGIRVGQWKHTINLFKTIHSLSYSKQYITLFHWWQFAIFLIFY